jgi:two-component system, NtrC family, response regulator AtoC
MTRVLVVDDEAHVRKALQTVLSKEGYDVDEAENGKAALAMLEEHPATFRLILLDLNMPEMSGMEFLKKIDNKISEIPIVILTAFSTAETTMEAMSLGAFDYIAKPFNISQIKQVVARAMDMNRLTEEAKSLQKDTVKHQSADSIIGHSAEMREVYKLVGKVASSRVTALIQGESGTGKELIAKSIHFNSSRAGHSLITINCGAIPENLLESELFGYEKGAFTGASIRKPGKFELAHQGTVFLDEVGELPMSLQVKLLRVLQEGEVEVVGGTQTLKVDVRVIAATNRNLIRMVQAGQFREDLYYRLNVVSIHLPPLRNRKEDIPELARFFLAQYAKEFETGEFYISPEAMEHLLMYDWPGNVRELQNIVYRAAVMAPGKMIMSEHLPDLNEDNAGHDSETNQFEIKEKFNPGFTMREVLRRAEMEAMKWALQRTFGNKAQAARMLDMSRKAFVYKCQEYELDT